MAGLLQDSGTVVGDDGDNTFNGGEGDDVIHGGGGADDISGRSGADTLIGGAGADRLSGGTGRDVLYGGRGADELVFVASADRGGFGDRLFGGTGVDTLRLEFTLDEYTSAVEAEILAYFQTLSAGEDPGAGGEFAFETFALRVQGVEAVRLFVDGVEITPGDAPTGAARPDDFSVDASGLLEEGVAANDGPVAGGVFSLLDDVGRGTLTFNADGTFAYDPGGEFIELSAGETETETFVYQFDDGAGGLTSATVTIAIEGENEAPDADDVRDLTDEDTAISLSLVGLSEATDIDRLDVLSVTSVEGVDVADDVVTFTIASGAVVRLFPDGAVDYDPVGAFDELPEGGSTTDEFEFTIGDGQGGTVTRRATIEIAGVNDAPFAIEDVIFVSEGETAEFAPLANDFDIEGDAVSFLDFDDPTDLAFRDNDVLFFDALDPFESLNAGATAEVALTYTIADPFGDESTGFITIVVEGENDAPIVVPLFAATDETVPSFTFDLLTDQTDIDDGSVLSIENLVEIDTSFGGTLVGSTFSFTPTTLGFLQGGETRTITYSYDVVDDQGARVENTFQLVVSGVDGALAAADDLFTTSEDDPLFEDVSLNDNFDSGAVFSLISATGSGVLDFNADGTFDFDPAGFYDDLAVGETDVFEFDYRITVGGETTQATATIEIEGLNDGPFLLAPNVAGITAVSLNPAGGQGGNADSRLPFISADGADIVFASAADNLVVQDPPASTNVFFRNLEGGQTGLVAPGADGDSDRPSLTADGRTLFISAAQNIDGPTPVNGAFLFDPNEGAATLVSTNGAGEAANGVVETPSISADGRFVTFTSSATNLDDDDINGDVRDVFLKDLETGSTQLISQLSGADTGASFDAKISADGGTVVFHTENALVGADVNDAVDVYALDLGSGAIELISQNNSGQVGDADSVFATAQSSVSVSANGRYVAFSSLASNISPLGDQNGLHDIFVRDRFEGRTEVISITSTGTEGDGFSLSPVISADGRFVAFQTAATNLVGIGGDENDLFDVYVHDRVTEETIRASADFNLGVFQEPGGFQPTISADGRFVGFVSSNTTTPFLTPISTAEIDQVFVADLEFNGFSFDDDDAVVSVDFAEDVFDPEFDELFISGVSIVSDDSDRIVDFTLEPSGGAGLSSPLVQIDFSQFDGLGANDFEILTATYDITDGSASVTNTIGIVVEGVNDAPIIDDETVNAVAGTEFSGSFGAFDPEGDEVTFSVVGPPSIQSFSLDDDGSYQFTANPGEVGANVLTIAADDGQGGVTNFSFTINVGVGVNQDPVFTPLTGAAVALAGQAVSIDLSTLFSDPDGDDLTFAATQATGDPLFALSIDASTGVLTGTHDAERLDRIEVTATDGAGGATSGEIWLAYVDEAVIDGEDGEQLSGALPSTYFEGRGGDDLIFGGAGLDIFAYDFADNGFDQIEDAIAGGDGFVLIDGALSGDVSFTRLGVGDDLLITLIGEETTFDRGVLFSDGLGANRLAGVAFADGEIVELDEIRADVLAGEATGGDDLIRGFASEDMLVGGVGDDTLRGGDGADTYMMTPDGGFDLIEDNGFFDADRLEIAAASSTATFVQGPSDDDLTIEFAGGGGVTIVNALDGEVADQVETIVFNDVSFAIAEVRQLLVERQQTALADVVTAFGTGDGEVLTGGGGDDTLFGGEGSDVYVYRSGDGDDVIRENGGFDTDEVQIFGFTLETRSIDGLIEPTSEVQFRRAEDSPDDLLVLLDNGSLQGSIRVVDGLSGGAANTVEAFTFPDQGITIAPDLIREDLIAQQLRAGAVEIVGFNTDDTIDMNAAAQVAQGGDGADTYIYSTGDGAITIDDNGFFDNDRVVLRNLEFADVAFSAGEAAGRDLVIRPIDGTIDDVLRVLNGLDNDVAHTVELFEDSTGAVLTRSQIQTIITAAEASGGRGFVTGGFEADTLPTTIGDNAIVEGLDGADIFTYVFRNAVGERAGDGADVFIDSGFGDIDQVIIQGLTTADIASGAVEMRFDSQRNEVRFDFGAGDALTIVGARDDGGAFGRIVFDDVTFDDNANDGDGRPSFAAFVAAQGTAAVEVAGTADDDLLFSPGSGPVDEVFLTVGGADVVELSATEIGDDVITRGNVATNVTIDIDFSSLALGASAGELFFSRAAGSPNDLQIVIVSSPAVTAPIVERVVVIDALSTNSTLDQVRIIDDSIPVAVFTIDDIGQIVTDGQASFDDDLITPTQIDDQIFGGLGDDVIENSRGNDTFNFAVGDGRDLIRERFIGSGDNDVLAIDGYAPVDMELRLSPTIDGGLVLDFGEDEVTLELGLGTGARGVDFISFEDTADLFTREVLIQRFVAQQIAADAPTLIGGDFADVLVAGASTTFMSGGAGDDVYRLSPAIAQDITIRESGGDDVVELGVDADEVTFRVSALDPADLLIEYASGPTVTIDNTNTSAPLTPIEAFEFADGTGITRAEARALALANGATAGDDRITGTVFDDVVTGGAGSDSLFGGGGSDRYVYTVGEGDDVIVDVGVNGDDVLVINGATEAQTTFRRELRDTGGDDLILTFASGEGSVRVRSSLLDVGDLTRIDQIEFADSGTTITINEARQRATDGLSGTSSGKILGLLGVDDEIAAGAGLTVVDGLTGNDTYVFAAGAGVMVINDSALSTDPAVAQRLRIDGVASADATLTRLAENSEHFVVTFAGSTDRILVLGERFIDENALGVETIEFTADGVTFTEADINSRLNGFSPAIRADGPPVAEGLADDEGDAPVAGLTLFGAAGAEELIGGDGDDVIRAGGGADTLNGGLGDDLLAGQGGSDVISGGAGNDRLNGGVGSDELHGGADDDQVIGNRGADLLLGSDGADTVRGGGGDDALLGGDGQDVLFGGGGQDVIFGDDGADELLGRRHDDDLAGGRGADTLGGGEGDDTLSGGAGADQLRGGQGADELAGGGGADELSGDAGADILRGDRGADLLSGGAGADVFVFRDGFAASGEEDVVTDFEVGLDRIDVSALSGVGDLSDLTLLEVAGDTLIFAAGAGDAPVVGETPAVRLVGVAADDLSGADFLF